MASHKKWRYWKCRGSTSICVIRQLQRNKSPGRSATSAHQRRAPSLAADLTTSSSTKRLGHASLPPINYACIEQFTHQVPPFNISICCKQVSHKAHLCWLTSWKVSQSKIWTDSSWKLQDLKVRPVSSHHKSTLGRAFCIHTTKVYNNTISSEDTLWDNSVLAEFKWSIFLSLLERLMYRYIQEKEQSKFLRKLQQELVWSFFSIAC